MTNSSVGTVALDGLVCPILIVPFHLLTSMSWIYSGDNNFFNSALLVRQTSLCTWPVSGPTYCVD